MFTDTAEFQGLELPFDLPHGEFESPAQEEDYWADFSILEDISEDR